MVVNDETNLLRLITPWLNNSCQIKSKRSTVIFSRTKHTLPNDRSQDVSRTSRLTHAWRQGARGGEARPPYLAWRHVPAAAGETGTPHAAGRDRNRCHGNGRKVDQLSSPAATATARDVHEWVGDWLTSRSSTGWKERISYVATSRR